MAKAGSSILVASTVFLLLLTPQMAEGACGDANGNGAVTISDMVYLLEYLFAGGPAPPNYEEAETDDHEGLTVVDASYLLCFFTCPPAHCPAENPPWPTPVDSSVRIIHPETFPGNWTSMRLDVSLFASGSVSGIQLPLEVRINGEIPEIDSVQVVLTGSVHNTDWITFSSFDSDSGRIAFSTLPISPGTLPTKTLICSIWISISPSPDDRPIELSWYTHEPEQLPEGESEEIGPLIIHDFSYQPVEPIFTTECCYVPGDANQDGQATISDALYIILYVFGSPPQHPCPSEMDANSDGNATITDAVYIINYIFGGGPAPECGN